MASKVHGQVLGHYVPEEMIFPPLYGIGIIFKSVTNIYLRQPLMASKVHGCVPGYYVLLCT